MYKVIKENNKLYVVFSAVSGVKYLHNGKIIDTTKTKTVKRSLYLKNGNFYMNISGAKFTLLNGSLDFKGVLA